MEIRIVHTSDVHLDASFRSNGVPSDRARERCGAHLEAFDRIVDEAARLDAHLLAIAGDLFEAKHARPATGRHVVKRLAAWSRPVCIAPGNHDPLQEDSLYRLLDWPDNVTIFGPRWSRLELPDLGLTVHGRGFTAPEETSGLLEGLQVTGGGRHVLVAHGSDVSRRPDRHDPYRPFTPEELDALPVSYVALGHYHGFSVLPTLRVRAVYSGSPIPQGFNESGVHGVVLARLYEDRTEVEQIPLPARRFETLRVDLSGLDTEAELVARLRQEMSAHQLQQDFVRLRLQGSLPPDFEVDRESLRAALKGSAYEIGIRDETVPEYDLEALSSEKTVRGHFVRTLLAQLESAAPRERAILQRAIHYGLDAFAGRLHSR